MRKAISFQITGGNELRGAISTNTAKNSAVALLQTSLLNQGKTIIRDIPQIEDVKRIIEVLESIGARFKWLNERDAEITVKKINIASIDAEAANKTRSIILLIGPLVHYLSHFKIPQAKYLSRFR